MKKTIRLTESDLINLVKRIVKEQEEGNSLQEYMDNLDHIANEFHRHITEEELDLIFNEIEYMLDSAVKEGELSDDELEELHDYASDLARELEFEFKVNSDLHEGTKAKKPKAIRSKKSGVKTQKIIDQNHKVLRRIVSEQPESRYGPEQYMSHSERQDFQSGNSERAGAALMSGAQKQSAAIHSINPHTLLAIAGLASVFIPVVGPFVAAGIGMMDAGVYLKEGKKKEAAIVGLFSLLPGILKVTKLIPGIAQLGQKGMAALGSKVASGAELTTAEAGIVDSIAANQAVVSSEAEAVARNMANTGLQNATKAANQATKETLKHIAKHGLEKGVEHTLVHAAGEHGAEQIPSVASKVGKVAAREVAKGISTAVKAGIR